MLTKQLSEYGFKFNTQPACQITDFLEVAGRHKD
jgi:hypothetical protein